MKAERLADDVRHYCCIQLENKLLTEKKVVFFFKCRCKINEAKLTSRHKDGDYVMINLCRDSQGHIHSFKSSW